MPRRSETSESTQLGLFEQGRPHVELSPTSRDRRRVATLWDAQTADQLSVAERVAKSLDVQQQPYRMEKPPYDFDAAFRSLAVHAPQMLLVLSSPLFTPHRSRIAELAIQCRLPTMFTFKAYVEAGGLISYGVDTLPM